MRYASRALRTLSRLDLMSSRGISSMSEALWSLERKCSCLMRHEHFPVFHPPYSCYFLQLLIVIVSFRLLQCYVIYLAHAYILNFQISNCNVFVYVTLTFLRYPIVTVFIVTTFATRSVSNIPWRRKAVPFEILERKNIFPKPWNQPCSYIICSTIYCWLDPLLLDPVLLFCRGGPC